MNRPRWSIISDTTKEGGATSSNVVGDTQEMGDIGHGHTLTPGSGPIVRTAGGTRFRPTQALSSLALPLLHGIRAEDQAKQVIHWSNLVFDESAIPSYSKVQCRIKEIRDYETVSRVIEGDFIEEWREQAKKNSSMLSNELQVSGKNEEVEEGDDWEDMVVGDSGSVFLTQADTQYGFSGSPSVRDDVDGVCSTAVEREKELNELEKQLKYVHEHSEWRPDPKYRHVNTVGLFSALKHALDNPLIDSRTLKQKKLSSQTHTLGTKRMRGKPRHHLSKTVAFPPMSSSGSCDDEFQGVSTKPRIVCADMVKTLRG
ncbi:hypothetical protein ADUPG1_002040, partial [Aduncisulcus paluster]